MDYTVLHHLAEELKENPYVQSNVTHIFSSGEKEVLTLQYSKETEQFQVRLLDLGQISHFDNSDQVAAAIIKALESTKGQPSPC
ncbi:hypothetical protein AM500_14255 [Bacillus sp. FJAT-18017]|uniref:hypothetical protein n=1 Tax=Bacillus sp. FJAT-18017 TaxID=1705566 RepID=UPI0006AEC6AA|nr:hypothetical protein [Bacillus sp. FJAT-18017]ALC90822.1 hypothetical protein AM500_14255 [Bacillus sp. FJAT-18017]